MRGLIYVLLLLGFGGSLGAQSDPPRIRQLKADLAAGTGELVQSLETVAQYYYDERPAGFVDSLLRYRGLILTQARQHGDPQTIARARGNLGEELVEAGRFGEAQRELFAAIDYYESVNKREQLTSLYNCVSYLFSTMGDNDKGLFFAEKAYKTGHDYPTFNTQIQALEHLSSSYRLVGNYPAALRASDELLVTLDNFSDSTVSSDYYIAYRDRANLFYSQEKYGEATKAAFEGLKVPLDDHDLFYRMELEALVGINLNRLGRYAEAIDYLQPMIQHAIDRDDVVAIDDELMELALAYEMVGDAKSALGYYRLAWKIREGQFQGDLATMEDGLAVRYQTDEFREEVSRQNEIIAQQQRIQLLTSGGVALLVFGLIGLFYGLWNNRRKNLLLENRNRENVLLLQEIHHRVKNNLEVVASLLELQSAGLTDAAARDAMQAGQSRVQSMGLLHQKLYQGSNLAAIEMRDYFHNLAAGLLETYEEEDRIIVNLSMPPLELDVGTAVPLGLIVNELLTNAIKYAFGRSRAGTIEISLSGDKATGYRLCVRDDGAGKDFGRAAAGTGFGSRLVQLLARQLGGELTEMNDGGLRTELLFGGGPERRKEATNRPAGALAVMRNVLLF